MGKVILKNLLPNSNFETGNYDDYKYYSQPPTITTATSYSGSYSLHGANSTSGSGTERCLTYNNKIQFTQGHIYYYGLMQYLVSGFSAIFYSQETVPSSNCIQTYNQWVRNGAIGTATTTKTSPDFRIGPCCYGSQICEMYVDDLFFIDLTDGFGAGNEPALEWCNNHIPLFTGSCVLDTTSTLMRVKYNNNYILNNIDSLQTQTKQLNCSGKVMSDNIQIEVYK